MACFLFQWGRNSELYRGSQRTRRLRLERWQERKIRRHHHQVRHVCSQHWHVSWPSVRSSGEGQAGPVSSGLLRWGKYVIVAKCQFYVHSRKELTAVTWSKQLIHSYKNYRNFCTRKLLSNLFKTVRVKIMRCETFLPSSHLNVIFKFKISNKKYFINYWLGI